MSEALWKKKFEEAMELVKTTRELLAESKEKPLYISSERVVSFDVDDTLVMWHDDNTDKDVTPGEGKIRIPNPYYRKPSRLQTEYDRLRNPPAYYLTPHKKHISKLKGYSQAKWTVVVWSNGKAPWARNVLRELELLDYVDYIISKPQIMFDDERIGDAFRERKYYQPKGWKK